LLLRSAIGSAVITLAIKRTLCVVREAALHYVSFDGIQQLVKAPAKL
jgi:hypothetical protein